jgi:hypothetical protein
MSEEVTSNRVQLGTALAEIKEVHSRRLSQQAEALQETQRLRALVKGKAGPGCKVKGCPLEATATGK